MVQLLELRVQLHELPRHAVDASVQVPVLAVLPVEVLLVAQPALGAAYPGVRPEHDREGAQTHGQNGRLPRLQKRSVCNVLTVDSLLRHRPLQAPRWQTALYLALKKKLHEQMIIIDIYIFHAGLWRRKRAG